MALSQYTKKALQRSIKCGTLCISIPKHGFNIIRTSIVYLILSRTQNTCFCLYIGGTSFNSHSGHWFDPWHEEKVYCGIFLPRYRAASPNPPPHICQKESRFKNARTASNWPVGFSAAAFWCGVCILSSTDHSLNKAADSFADRVLDPAPFRYE